MRSFRRSFRARLILGAVVWITLGLAISSIALSRLFRDQVVDLFDAELDGHADELQELLKLDPQGRPFLDRALSDPRFEPVGSGFYWQVEPRGGPAVRSPSLGDFDLKLGADPPPVGDKRQILIAGPTGPLVLLERSVLLRGAGVPVYIGIGADERLLDDVIMGFNRTLLLSLAVIALGLMGAAVAQVTYGLQPMNRIRAAVAAVRSGEAERLPEDLPTEVVPLVTDLNGLLEANQAMLKRARVQAGNLAHALKTPLAILLDESARLASSGREAEGRLLMQQCESMRRHLDYHLAQARAGALRMGPGSASAVGPAMRDLVNAMERLHHDRGIVFEIAGDPGQFAVACNIDDLNEMLGNLIDNAAKWAATRVRITPSLASPGTLRLCVEDDGEGMPSSAYEKVFGIGERLDERAPGTGLGLAIVRDLADLYGGRVWIEKAALGGVAAILQLPLVKKPAVS